MGAVIKKELKNYFLSPIGYIVIGIFLLTFSSFFFLTSIDRASIDLTYLFYYTAQYGLMFITPLLTMWTFSGERKAGTDQILLTSPVSMLGVVIAKFLSSFLLIVIPVLCTLMYFAILSFFGMPDIPTSLVALLGFLLLNMAYISFGILASSLTENQIIAGLLTIGFFIINWMLPSLNQVFSNYALIDIFSKFVYGQIDIADTATFVLFTILCLLLTIIGLQRRKSIR